MSRIITELTCKHCDHTKETYVSFGHPDSDFDFPWTCDKCGKDNAEHIKAWIDVKGPKNDAVIYQDNSCDNVKIFNSDMTVFSTDKFQWNLFEDEQEAECFGGYLTLEDISGQIKKLLKSEYIGVIYVWVESPLYGVIYQYGNYNDGMWRVHGKTNGYA